MSAPEKLADIERKLLQKLQENKNGLSTKDIADQTQSLTPEERVTLINRLTSTGDVELLSIDGTNNTVLRYRKSTLAPGATAEEQLVYSLIEAADKSGIWVRDLREQSGLTEPIIRRVLKGFEQRKLVKSIKAVGTQKKSYILYNIEADESVTGGTFYSNQQFDSQFVQALIDFCVNALKSRQKEAEEKFPYDARAQAEFASVSSEFVAQYIHEKGVSKVHLSISDVENILNVAMVDGKLEKQPNNTYRASEQPMFVSPLVSMPCFTCPVRNECCPGHRISPENCEYIKNIFDL